MLILEGPDATGKSTLAAKIAEAVGWPVVHSGGPSRGPGEIVRRTCLYLCRSKAVYDRFPLISEPIYSRILGRECGFIDEELYILTARLRELQPLVVTCMSIKGAHVVKDSDSEEHLKGIALHESNIHAAYKRFFSSSGLPQIADTHPGVIDACLEHARIRL